LLLLWRLLRKLLLLLWGLLCELLRSLLDKLLRLTKLLRLAKLLLGLDKLLLGLAKLLLGLAKLLLGLAKLLLGLAGGELRLRLAVVLLPSQRLDVHALTGSRLKLCSRKASMIWYWLLKNKISFLGPISKTPFVKFYPYSTCI
jgi:hypothetical protein